MLDRIISFSISNKLIVGIGVLGLIIWGVISYKNLPVDAVPDITNNQVQVITSAPSSGAEDIERLVTYPIEQTMASIPGIEEIRSFSRFGLSVVTIVFTDDTDVYWARDQVNQRLSEAKTVIPTGIGEPTMAPVSTGLGEIFQYIIKPKKGYEKEYDATELRTIQDWIVRRQLLGTPGIADVSGFGGKVKQYEVAVRTADLQRFNIHLQDLFDALEKNNSNTGGSYLTRSGTTYYIRSEGLTRSIAEIESIPLAMHDQYPVLVKDVATVKIGSAIRYGALTNADKGEAVGGIVLMLKDANASSVIVDVKERMAQIEKTLPKGVEIEVYLDRTKLVDRAITTVSTNLIEGALIVIFILVLLLGNLRAGLIVASVIPLAMLFAISMMNVFGVSGNLMSLGAIDFGLIVDGAVIIVEATLHHLVVRRNKNKLTQDQLNQEVERSAKSIMKSAAFGEIIILIVYLPLLTLVGIEGKMFAPMAQTVIFAIIGAFILSLTYVPMISSLVLSKKPLKENTFSDKLVHGIQRIYRPFFLRMIRIQKGLIISVMALFVFAVWLFGKLGAEFIPSLDEGDFAVELRAPTGTSLEETRDITLRAAASLKKNFPDEVITCIGKIGTAEIPTDPMPMEACDLMIILKDKHEWKKAHNRDDLAALMQAKLEEEVLGATYGFQQPIQMRFNEMMAGAKQDVVVKIYGEDLNELMRYARQVGGIAQTIQGAADIYVEEVTGLPQIVIRYNRQAMAQYGVSVEDVNRAVNMGFAGSSAGQVYEGEKRFDLVVRLDAASRKTMEDIHALTVVNRSGQSIPIGVLAKVTEENGPNQIQRDDAKRRIIVAFNVRGRDVESIVKELQTKVLAQVKFGTGYFATYGGSYKNLEKAKERLAIAVPLALFLIIFLLFITFQDIKQALLIFTAIPLAAIGGVFALWLRDMPFSISAGVGFIALFGVAVLNGIVLVAAFNELRKRYPKSIYRVIILGTHQRLRPVMMTALVASLGFLPMALSTGSGAEVQKPLATVVIGGLVTATFLTLFLLPIMYSLIIKRSMKKSHENQGHIQVLLPLILISGSLFGQSSLSVEQCVQKALSSNPLVVNAQLAIEQTKWTAASSVAIPQTNVNAMLGQYNSAAKNDNNFSINQSIPFPTIFSKAKRYGKEDEALRKLQAMNISNQLELSVRSAYDFLVYVNMREKQLMEAISSYQQLRSVVDFQVLQGERSEMEAGLVSLSMMPLEQQLSDLRRQRVQAHRELQDLIFTKDSIIPTETSYPFLLLRSGGQQTDSTTILRIEYQQATKLEAEKTLLQAQRLPVITLGYFNQTLIGTQNINGQEVAFTASDRFQGVQAGISIPIFMRAENSRVKQQEISVQQAQNSVEQRRLELSNRLEAIRSEWQIFFDQQQVWENQTRPTGAKVQEQLQFAFQKGEISMDRILIQKEQWIQLQLMQLERTRSANVLLLEYNYLNQ